MLMCNTGENNEKAKEMNKTLSKSDCTTMIDSMNTELTEELV